jgi:hypothetical protein
MKKKVNNFEPSREVSTKKLDNGVEVLVERYCFTGGGARNYYHFTSIYPINRVNMLGYAKEVNNFFGAQNVFYDNNTMYLSTGISNYEIPYKSAIIERDGGFFIEITAFVSVESK